MLRDCKESGYGLDISSLPRNKSEAKEMGFQYFYTGKSCKHGHNSPRYTYGGSCVQCQRERNIIKKHGDLSKSIKSYAIANITRVNAAANNQKTFVPAYPCKHGHYLRWVSSNNCVECGSLSDKRRKEKTRWSRIKREYGITKEDFYNILNENNHKCKICTCEINELNSHIDHCHVTGKVRGVLCQKCNQAIGLLREDTAIMERAIKYVKENHDIT